MNNVFFEREFCISPSGPQFADVVRDYERGRRPLQVFSLPEDPDYGVFNTGVIAPEVLGLSQPSIRSDSIARIQAGLARLLEQVAKQKPSAPYDGIVIGRGRIRQYNLLALEHELLNLISFDELAIWIAEKCRELGIPLRDERNISFVDGTCSSGLQVVNMAWKRIRKGLWRNALVVAFDPNSLIGYSRLRALGVLSEAPLDESPKIFRDQRDGFVKSECFAALTLSADSAAHGERFRVVGSAVTNDASSLVAMDSAGRGLEACIAAALRLAGLEPRDIGLIKAHGTGTDLNDRVEAGVIRRVFGDGSRTPVVAFKSQFGHMTNASGLFELLLMKNCLQAGRIKKVPLSQPLSADCNIALASEDMRIEGARYALALSMGFGGINSALILEKVNA